MKKYIFLIFLIFLNIIINYSFSQSRVDTYYSSGYMVYEKKYNAECYIFYQYDDNRLTAVGLMAKGTSSIDGTILYAVEILMKQ